MKDILPDKFWPGLMPLDLHISKPSRTTSLAGHTPSCLTYRMWLFLISTRHLDEVEALDEEGYYYVITKWLNPPRKYNNSICSQYCSFTTKRKDSQGEKYKEKNTQHTG